MITRKMGRYFFSLMAVGMLTAFALGLLTMKALQAQPKAAAVVFDGRLMSGERPLDVLSLREIAGELRDDAAILDAVTAYYEANADRLALVFNERNDQRLRGLFGMYAVHVSQPYNTVPSGWEAYTLRQFIDAEAAHCGLYSRAQSMIYTALGLRWNNVLVDGGWHGLIEAQIGERWETFDATTNVWLSVSVGALINGVARSMREFYTPVWDASTDELYRRHYTESGGYYSVPDLRAGLPLWGISVRPARWAITASG